MEKKSLVHCFVSRLGFMVFLILMELAFVLPSTAQADVFPLIRGNNITLTKGAPAQTFKLTQKVATVGTSVAELSILLNYSRAGVIVSNVRIASDLTVVAEVQADCTAIIGTGLLPLYVTDGVITGNAFPAIKVVNAEEPQYPSPVPVSLNSARAIVPEFLPAGYSNFSVSSPTFKGDLSVNQTTGVITVERAKPVGSHTLTLTTNGWCSSITKTISLIVASGNVEYQGAVGESAPAGGSKSGSVLMYNYYRSSSSGDFAAEDTRITLQNQHLSLGVWLHYLFFSGGGSADMYEFLAPQTTRTLLLSGVVPSESGRLIVVATDNQGRPTSFNYLKGSEDIWLASGYRAQNIPADSYQALFPEGTSLSTSENFTASINFDGVSYSKAARTLIWEDVPISVDQNETLMILNCVSDSQFTAQTLNGIWYEKKTAGTFYPFSQTIPGWPLFTGLGAGQLHPANSPNFYQLLTQGRNWQMVVNTVSNVGISGLWLSRNPKSKGGTLRALALTDTAYLVVPVFAPGF